MCDVMNLNAEVYRLLEERKQELQSNLEKCGNMILAANIKKQLEQVEKEIFNGKIRRRY